MSQKIAWDERATGEAMKHIAWWTLAISAAACGGGSAGAPEAVVTGESGDATHAGNVVTPVSSGEGSGSPAASGSTSGSAVGT